MPDVSIIFDKPKPAPPTDTVMPSYKQWKQQQVALNAPSNVPVNRPMTNESGAPPPIQNKKNVKFDMQPKCNAEQFGAKTQMPRTTTTTSPLPFAQQQPDHNVFDDNFRRANLSPQVKYTEKRHFIQEPTPYQHASNVPTGTAANTENNNINMNDLYQLTKVLLKQIEHQQKPANDNQQRSAEVSHPPVQHHIIPNYQNDNGYGKRETTPAPPQHYLVTQNHPTIKQMEHQQQKPVNGNQQHPTGAPQIPMQHFIINQNDDGCAGQQHYLVTNNHHSVAANVLSPPNQCVRRQDDADEPTMKDLFKIIVKQQEQLVRLQDQVQRILLCGNNAAITGHTGHAPRAHVSQNQTSPPHEHCRKAVGVMTSLEINIQKNYQANGGAIERGDRVEMQQPMRQSNNQCKCDCGQQPSNVPSNRVFDPIAAPDAVHHIVTSDDEDDQAEGGKPPGWTFYGNILEQVNHVLENSPPVNNNSQSRRPAQQQPESPMTDMRSSNVRMAQFKQIGFKCDDVNISAMSKK